MKSWLKQLTFRSIEISSKILTDQKQPLALSSPHITHYLLPDLPSVTNEVRQKYFSTFKTPHDGKIITLSACKHFTEKSVINSISLEDATTSSTKSYSNNDNIYLVVGGNDKNLSLSSKSSSFSSARVIEIITTVRPQCQVWCVWDPNNNSPEEMNRLISKIQSGACGIITQPILTLTGWENIYNYSNCYGLKATNTKLVVGVAFPTSIQTLHKWKTLLSSPDSCIDNDPLYLDHVSYFSNLSLISKFPSSSPSLSIMNHLRREWLLQQCALLSECDNLYGMHFMPWSNYDDLHHLLYDL